MIVATTVVVVLPVVLAWSLRASGTISSPWVCAGCALVFALVASLLGRLFWERHNSSDVVFSELLVWGWARRVRIERQVARCAQELIADVGEPVGSDGSLGLHGTSRPAGAGDAGAPGVGAERRRLQVLTRLAAALDAQDPYLAGHSHRVARYATGTALKLGLDADECARIQRAALIHDIGKLQIPDALLTKPGRLTSDEFELTKSHAEAGAKMAACLGDAELAEIVRHHHERFDGTGYPSGLHGEEIPLGARVIAVADTFDAVTSLRPYRPAARHKRAIEVLRAGSGSQFDPAVVHAFIAYYSGRAFAAWALVAVAPQRPFAWPLSGPAARPTSWGNLAAALGAGVVVVAAAVAAPFGSGGAHGATRPLQAVEAVKISRSPAPGGHRARRAHSAHAGRVILTAAVVTPAQPAKTRSAAHRGAGSHPSSPAAPGTAAPGGGTPSGGSPSGGAQHHGHTSPPPPAPGGGAPGDRPRGGAPPPSPTPGGSSSPPPPTTTTTSSSSTSTSSTTTSSSSTTVASGPRSKSDCRDGGWGHYGFSNQGQCIDYLVHHGG
jgi:putative nucleotidyltransferase with HDIG domain